MKKEIPKKTYRKTRAIVVVIALILTLVAYFLEESPLIGLRAVSFFCFILIFAILDHFFEIGFEVKHYIFIIIIGSSGLLLTPLYYVLTTYDKVLHLVNPILINSIIFFMVSKLKISLKWKILFTFLTVISLLAFWEIGEYGLDKLFDMKNQGVFFLDKFGKFNMVESPIDDTMQDLSFGVIGAALYTLGYTFFSKEKDRKP